MNYQKYYKIHRYTKNNYNYKFYYNFNYNRLVQASLYCDL